MFKSKKKLNNNLVISEELNKDYRKKKNNKIKWVFLFILLIIVIGILVFIFMPKTIKDDNISITNNNEVIKSIELSSGTKQSYEINIKDIDKYKNIKYTVIDDPDITINNNIIDIIKDEEGSGIVNVLIEGDNINDYTLSIPYTCKLLESEYDVIIEKPLLSDTFIYDDYDLLNSVNTEMLSIDKNNIEILKQKVDNKQIISFNDIYKIQDKIISIDKDNINMMVSQSINVIINDPDITYELLEYDQNIINVTNKDNILNIKAIAPGTLSLNIVIKKEHYTDTIKTLDITTYTDEYMIFEVDNNQIDVGVDKTIDFNYYIAPNNTKVTIDVLESEFFDVIEKDNKRSIKGKVYGQDILFITKSHETLGDIQAEIPVIVGDIDESIIIESEDIFNDKIHIVKDTTKDIKYILKNEDIKPEFIYDNTKLEVIINESNINIKPLEYGQYELSIKQKTDNIELIKTITIYSTEKDIEFKLNKYNIELNKDNNKDTIEILSDLSDVNITLDSTNDIKATIDNNIINIESNNDGIININATKEGYADYVGVINVEYNKPILDAKLSETNIYLDDNTQNKIIKLNIDKNIEHELIIDATNNAKVTYDNNTNELNVNTNKSSIINIIVKSNDYEDLYLKLIVDYNIKRFKPTIDKNSFNISKENLNDSILFNTNVSDSTVKVSSTNNINATYNKDTNRIDINANTLVKGSVYVKVIKEGYIDYAITIPVNIITLNNDSYLDKYELWFEKKYHYEEIAFNTNLKEYSVKVSPSYGITAYLIEGTNRIAVDAKQSGVVSVTLSENGYFSKTLKIYVNYKKTTFVAKLSHPKVKLNINKKSEDVKITTDIDVPINVTIKNIGGATSSYNPDTQTITVGGSGSLYITIGAVGYLSSFYQIKIYYEIIQLDCSIENDKFLLEEGKTSYQTKLITNGITDYTVEFKDGNNWNNIPDATYDHDTQLITINTTTPQRIEVSVNKKDYRGTSFIIIIDEYKEPLQVTVEQTTFNINKGDDVIVKYKSNYWNANVFDNIFFSVGGPPPYNDKKIDYTNGIIYYYGVNADINTKLSFYWQETNESVKFDFVVNVKDKQPLEEVANETIGFINGYRNSLGLSTLSTDTNLNAACMVRAKETLTLTGHTRPDGTSYETAISNRDSYIAVTEILKYGGLPSGSVEEWKGSEIHNAVLKNANHNTIGVGVARDNYGGYNFCAILGTK